MQSKYFLFIFCWLICANSVAYSSGFETASTIESFDSCEINAPGNYHAESVGSSWVTLAWDYQTDALGGYRIRTYRTSDNVLINTTFRPQGVTNATIFGLTSGVEYKFVINSLCANNVNSTIYDYTVQTPIIGELIVQGFSGNYNGPILCTINQANSNYPNNPTTPGTFCTFSNNPELATPFRISNGSAYRDFGLKQKTYKVFQSCLIDPNNSQSPIKFYGDTTTETATCFLDNHGMIRYQYPNGLEETIARYKADFTVSNGWVVVFTYLQSGWQIYKYNAAEPRSAPATFSTPTISPNPFSDQLEVNLGAPLSSEAQLQLLGLNGQLLIDNTLSAGQQQVSLQTNHLSPGIYLLRVVNDGQVQTWKVIKQE